MEKKRVLIVGGGAGGTILANSLDKANFDITVIDKSTKHFFQPQLLYIAFKGESKPNMKDERALLKKHVKFVNSQVTEINLNERSVSTSSGTYSYDFIAIATGIITNPNMISGLAEVNSAFGDYHTNYGQAQKLWSSLSKFSGGTIAVGQSYPVCKCPPSPLEGAFLAEEFIRKKGIRGKTRIVFFTPYPRAYPAEGINEVVRFASNNSTVCWSA